MKDKAIDELAEAILCEFTLNGSHNEINSKDLAQAISNGSLDKELEGVGLFRKENCIVLTKEQGEEVYTGLKLLFKFQSRNRFLYDIVYRVIFPQLPKESK